MPRQLHVGTRTTLLLELVKPANNLRVNDIDGTEPNVKKNAIVTERMSNPLNPEYQLSVVEQAPPTPPKFIRDSIPINALSLLTNLGHRWGAAEGAGGVCG